MVTILSAEISRHVAKEALQDCLMPLWGVREQANHILRVPSREEERYQDDGMILTLSVLQVLRTGGERSEKTMDRFSAATEPMVFKSGARSSLRNSGQSTEYGCRSTRVALVGLSRDTCYSRQQSVPLFLFGAYLAPHLPASCSLRALLIARAA